MAESLFAKSRRIALRDKLKTAASWTLDLIFPRFCWGCEKELGSREPGFICARCLLALPTNPSQNCLVCGIRSPSNETCPACRSKTKIRGLITVFSYQNEIIRKAIYALKYYSIENLAETLGRLAINHLKKEKLEDFFKEAILVPVPLYRRRQRRRGFNQSELIAKKIAEEFKIPVVSDLILRHRRTEIQAEIKDFKKRKANVSGAFKINPKKDFSVYKNSRPALRGSGGQAKIILIDDVITSGATLEVCAQALAQAGFKKIYAFAIARG